MCYYKRERERGVQRSQRFRSDKWVWLMFLRVLKYSDVIQQNRTACDRDTMHQEWLWIWEAFYFEKLLHHTVNMLRLCTVSHVPWLLQKKYARKRRLKTCIFLARMLREKGAYTMHRWELKVILSWDTLSININVLKVYLSKISSFTITVSCFICFLNERKRGDRRCTCIREVVRIKLVLKQKS